MISLYNRHDFFLAFSTLITTICRHVSSHLPLSAIVYLYMYNMMIRVQTRFILVFVFIGLFILHVCVAFYNMAHFENAYSLHFQNHLRILGDLLLHIWNQLHKIYDLECIYVWKVGPPTHGYHNFFFSHNLQQCVFYAWTQRILILTTGN